MKKVVFVLLLVMAGEWGSAPKAQRRSHSSDPSCSSAVRRLVRLGKNRSQEQNSPYLGIVPQRKLADLRFCKIVAPRAPCQSRGKRRCA